MVYNYNEGGIHVDEENTWSLCVALNLLNILDLGKGHGKFSEQEWDDKLEHHSQQPNWASKRYETTSLQDYLCLLNVFITYY